MEENLTNETQPAMVEQTQPKEVKQTQPKPLIPGLDKVAKTKVTTLKEKIKLTMNQLHDLATLEVMLDVGTRMKHRMKSVKEMGSARSIKVQGHWKTTPPKIYIAGLTGRKLTNNECEIRFSVFETDEKGNKKLTEHYSEVTLHNGDRIKRCVSAEYRIAYEVIETIQFRKPITREIMKIN